MIVANEKDGAMRHAQNEFRMRRFVSRPSVIC